MEKKRRDRINKSLDELKDLMALTDEVKRENSLRSFSLPVHCGIESSISKIRKSRNLGNDCELYSKFKTNNEHINRRL